MKLLTSHRVSPAAPTKPRVVASLVVGALWLCGVAAAQELVPFNQGGRPQGEPPRPVADPAKYIVKFAPGTSRAARAEAAIQSGATVRINYQVLNAIAITVPSVNALNGLRNNPSVLAIYPDYQLSEVQGKPLKTPTNLAAVTVSDSQINLTWSDRSNDETGFELERCQGSGCGSFALIATLPAGTTSYANTGLASATTYNYRVRAIRNGDVSAYSNTVEATTLGGATVPVAPSGLTGTAVSPSRVDLSWNDNSGNEDGFRVFRCSPAPCTPSFLAELATPDLESYSDTTVAPDTAYSYYVAGYNSVGQSTPSNQVDVLTPQESTAPNAPSNLAITSVSSSAIAMSWNDNSSDETGFEIERCQGSGCGGFAPLASVGADSTSYNDSTVADGITYGYRVRAVNGGEVSGWSNTAEGTTSPLSSPPPAETPITGGTRQRVPAGVQRVGPPGLLDDGTPSDGAGIGIAVLDSGLDYAHEDLGLDPEVIGANSYNAFNPALSAQDDRGHGTHVAGIIAARNNNLGVVGVAPNATLYGVKVLASDGTGDESIVTAGLDWVLANHNSVSPPIRVVNMSLGRPLDPETGETVNDATPFHLAIQALYDEGIVVVASAGNDPELETTQQIPSGYKEVFAVAGSVIDAGQNGCPEHTFAGPMPNADAAAIFTSDGAYVDGVGGVTTSAPSEERDDTLYFVDAFGFEYCLIAINGIQSTTLGGGISRLIPTPSGPSEAAGTSFAAPHVAGAVARIMQTGAVTASADSAGVEAIRTHIRNTADRRETAPPDPNEPPPAPEDNPLAEAIGLYSFDGEREGILQAPR